MPLFKHNHNDKHATDQPPVVGNSGFAPTSAGAGTGTAGLAGHHHTPATGTGITGGNPAYDSSGNGPLAGQHHGYGNDTNLAGRGTGDNYNHPHSGAGVGTGTGMGTGVHSGQGEYYGGTGAGDQSIPPSGVSASSHQHPGSGGGHALTGKVEAAVGGMIGSKSLKAKGLQKEQEAHAFKMQSSELAEAERLEKEALMRRERAVAHGAHPENKHLGGHNPLSSNNQSSGMGGGAY